MRDHRVSGVCRQGAEASGVMGRFVLGGACQRAALCPDLLVIFAEQSFRVLRHARSLLFFAARSAALVSPPLTLIRFKERRMPWVGRGARFELRVRELTPIQEISEDSRPYSIFGQRFITTLRPAASAFAAAASSRPPSCIQITLGSGVSFSASSTTGMIWLEFLKISTMSI